MGGRTARIGAGWSAVAVLALAGACTNESPAPPEEGSSTPPSSQELACADPIGGNPPPDDEEVVLDAVALPSSPEHPTLQSDASGEDHFAKHGLLVKAGVEFEVEVTSSEAGHATLGWGNPATSAPTPRLVVTGCPDEFGTGWLAYPGGYHADVPGCLTLTVRAGGQEQQVEIGVGAPCEGQDPPDS